HCGRFDVLQRLVQAQERRLEDVVGLLELLDALVVLQHPLGQRPQALAGVLDQLVARGPVPLAPAPQPDPQLSRRGVRHHRALRHTEISARTARGPRSERARPPNGRHRLLYMRAWRGNVTPIRGYFRLLYHADPRPAARPVFLLRTVLFSEA